MMVFLWMLSGLIAVVLLPLVVTLAEEAVDRWRYRHIPGPPTRWLTGNIHQLVRDGRLPTFSHLKQRYGKLFKLRFMNRLFVVVVDPDAIRTLLYKVTNRAPISNPNSNLVAGDLRAIDEYGILMAKDDYWRTLRTAWQPAFAPGSLKGYQALMDREALALVGRLEDQLRSVGRCHHQQEQGAQAAADSERNGCGNGGTGAGIVGRDGGDGSPGALAVVEMHEEMIRTTLAVVGTAAYGVDFTSPEYGGSSGAAVVQRPMAIAAASSSCQPGGGCSSGDPEPSLVQACAEWFRTLSPSYRSKWAIATAFPRFLPLMRHLASTLPDTGLAVHIRARRVLRKTSVRLIQGWRDAQRAVAASGSAAAAHNQEHGASLSGGGGAAGQRPSACSPGVAPGSFLGLMLAARDKSCGRGLSDVELDAQVQTFILAGFETTANALTFALYQLARHPDRAERLRAELDAYLPPPPSKEAAAGATAAGGATPLTTEILDKLVYTEAVLQEAMRLHPPLHSLIRLSDRPLNVLGHDIPAGTSFFIPILHLQRCEELWPDATAFRPERFLPGSAAGGGGGGSAGQKALAPAAAATADVDADEATAGEERGTVGGCGSSSAGSHNTRSENGNGGDGRFPAAAAAGGGNPWASRHPHVHLPFGAGSRMCIGWRFALQEAKTVLARLVQRFEFELVPGQIPLELSTGITLSPKHGVLVRVSRRAEWAAE